MPGGAGGAATTSASSTASTSGSGGAPVSTGDCETDADCAGSTCAEIAPGGFRTCVNAPKPVTSCGPGEMGCCNSDGCPSGAQCFSPFGYCGGIVGPQNKCLGPQCQSDDDCAAGSACMQAGVLGLPVAMCMVTACKAHADCTAMPGGACRPIADACCSGVFALWCVYPGGCQSNEMCPSRRCSGTATSSTAACQDAESCPL